MAALAASTGQQIGGLRDEFQRQFDAARAAGLDSDRALQAGIEAVAKQAAANQKSTAEQITQLGAGQAAQGQQIGQLQTDFNARVVELMRQGQDYQAANQQAQSELKQGQAQLGTQIGQVDQRVTDLMQQGQSYQDATGQALRELAAGQSGLGQQLGQLGSSIGQQITGLGQQQQAAQAALGRQITGVQQQANFGTLLGLLGGFGGQQAAPQQVPQAAPADIKYVYDIGGKSIFATPEQEKRFVTPYVEGGSVEDLMKILGD